MRKSQKTAVVGASVIAIVGGGIAFAAWTSIGEGTGTVTAGSQTDLVVDQKAGESVVGLFPTGDKNITFTVENKNPYPVKVSALEPTVDSVTGGAACSVTSSLVTATRTSPVNNTILAGQSSDYVVNIAMGADSDDACQGAVFTIVAEATGASAPAV